MTLPVPESQQQFGSLLTVLGENAEQNGKLQNKQIMFTEIAIGDANDTYVQPDRKSTALVNELARIPVNSVDVLQPTPDSVPMLKVAAVLPDDVNDLVIREFACVAVFNGQAYFHAVGNCARIYVPPPVNNGNVSTPVTLEMIFVITSAEPIIEIDPNVVTASREYVDKRCQQINRMQTNRNAIVWAPGLRVTDELQIYTHVDEAGINRNYLPAPENVPFVTGDSWEDDVIENRWSEYYQLTENMPFVAGDGTQSRSLVERFSEAFHIRDFTGKKQTETLNSSYIGDVMRFLPSLTRKGISIEKTVSGFKSAVNYLTLIGSGNKVVYIANKVEGTGTGDSLMNAMTWDGFQTKAATGEYDNIGSLIINLIDKVYDRHHQFDDFSVVQNTRVLVKSLCGGSWLTTKENLVWTKQANNIFTAEVPHESYIIRMAFHMNDADELGMPNMYRQVDNEGLLTDRTWCQVGTTISVKLPSEGAVFDARGITAIRAIQKYGLNFTGSAMFRDVYFCSGELTSVSTTSQDPIVFQRCKFLGGKQDAFGTVSAKYRVFLLDCIAAWAGKDCFNYHAYGHQAADDAVAVEVNCKAYNPGRVKYLGGNETTHSNNASTAHDSSTIWRFGCEYWDCEGPVVADVHGCRSMNYQVVVGSSLSSNTGVRSGFYSYDTDKKGEWAPNINRLVDCVIDGLHPDGNIKISGSPRVEIQNLKTRRALISSQADLVELTNE